MGWRPGQGSRNRRRRGRNTATTSGCTHAHRICPIKVEARTIVGCRERLRRLSMDHMDRMRVSIISFEPFDQGFGSLEAVFHFRKMPEFTFVSNVPSRVSRNTTRG